MRFIQAQLDGFGQLQNEQITLDAPFIIIYGPNEAGKSTWFSFLRTMLFGFASKGRATERLEPIFGGRHGGRLIFEDDTGGKYRIERYSDISRTKLKLYTYGAEGQAEEDIQQEQFAAAFLSQMEERLFCELYAISLTELQQIGALSGDELGKRLYQAGWEHGKRAEAAEKKLQEEMDQLYRRRGSSQLIINLIKQLETIDQQLKTMVDPIERYNNNNKYISELEHEQLMLEEKERDCRQYLILLEKAETLYELYMNLQINQSQRDPLLQFEYLPVTLCSQWEELQQKKSELTEQTQHMKWQLQQEEKKPYIYSLELVQSLDRAEKLLHEASAMKRLATEQTELERDLELLDEKIARQMTAISTEWTERQLRELPLTISAKDFIQRRKEKEKAYKQTQLQIELEIRTLTEQLDTAQLQQESNSEAILHNKQQRTKAVLPFRFKTQSREQLRLLWKKTDDAALMLQREWEQREYITQAQTGKTDDFDSTLSKQTGFGRTSYSNKIRLATIAVTVLTIIFCTTALTNSINSKQWSFGIIEILALLAAGLSAGLWWKNPFQAVKNRNEQQRQQTSIQPDLNELLKKTNDRYDQFITAAGELIEWNNFDLSNAAGRTQISTWLLQLKHAVQQLDQYYMQEEGLLYKLAEEESRIARLQQLLQKQQQQLDNWHLDWTAESSEWKVWLKRLSLPEEMSAEAVEEVYRLSEQTLEFLQQYDRLSRKNRDLSMQMDAFCSDAEAICCLADIVNSADSASQELFVRLELAVEKARQHKQVQMQKQQANEMREQLMNEQAYLMHQLQSIEQQEQQWIASSHEADRQQYEQALYYRKQLEQYNEGQITLQQQWKYSAAGNEAELEQLFSQYSLPQLSEIQYEEKERLAQLKLKRKGLHEQTGRLQQVQEQLMQAGEREALQQERAMLQQQLEASYARYTLLAVGKKLLQQTRAVYEQERQPLVLQQASKMISILTEGRYNKIIVPPTEQLLQLVDIDGRVVDSRFLSRGTVEQLFLSMRLALAEQAAATLKLPVLLDDVMVNFDKKRLTAAMKLMNSLTAERQLILFTCHEHVVQAAQENCQHVKIVQAAMTGSAALAT